MRRPTSRTLIHVRLPLAAAFLMAAILILSSSVYAESVISYNTTALFDAGLKAKIDTITNSCLAPANVFQLNASIGYYGISAACGSSRGGVSGSPEVATTSEKLAWDMETLTGGLMNDFSGNGNTGTITGTTSVTGKIGLGRSFAGNPATDNIKTSAPVSTATVNVSMSIWVKPTLLPQLGVIYFNGNSAAGGYGLMIGTTLGASGSKLILLLENIAFDDTGFTFPAANVWYHLTLTRDFTTWRTYVNGSQTSNTFTTNPVTPAGGTEVGGEIGNALRYYTGIADEALFFSRKLGTSEITNLATIGTFAGSGYWDSSLVTYTGEIPTVITVQWTGNSANTYVKGIAIINAQGNQAFNNTTAWKSGSLTSIAIPFSLLLENNWKVRITLLGNATATVAVSSISVITAIPSSPFPWVLVTLVFTFALCLTLGFYMEAPYFLLAAGVIGVFIGFQVFSLTNGDIPSTVFVMFVSAAIMVSSLIMTFGKVKET